MEIMLKRDIANKIQIKVNENGMMNQFGLYNFSITLEVRESRNGVFNGGRPEGLANRRNIYAYHN